MSGRHHLQRCVHKCVEVQGGGQLDETSAPNADWRGFRVWVSHLGSLLKAHLRSQPGGHSPVPAG